MKKIIIFIIIFAFSTIFSFARTYKENNIPPGMEVRKVDKVKFIVPKGSKITKEGSLIIIETTREYVARRFQELEKRLTQLEIEKAELQKELEEVKKTLAEIKKKDTPPQQ